MGCLVGAQKQFQHLETKVQGKSGHAERKTQKILFKRLKYAGCYDFSIQETGNMLFRRQEMIDILLAGKKRLKSFLTRHTSKSVMQSLPERVLSRVPHELMSSSRVTHE